MGCAAPYRRGVRNVLRAEDEAFYAGHRSARMPLVANDVVVVTAGIHAGRGASVISIESVRPEWTFLVEFADGKDAVLALQHLRLGEA